MNNLENDHSETNAKFDKIKDTQKASVSRRIFNHKYRSFLHHAKSQLSYFKFKVKNNTRGDKYRSS